MKRTQAKTIGQIVDDFLKQEQLDTQLDEYRACALWPEIMGQGVNRYTTRRHVNCGIMTVHIASAPLRNELTMMRSRIVEEINRVLGREVIKDIIFK